MHVNIVVCIIEEHGISLIYSPILLGPGATGMLVPLAVTGL